MASNARHTFRFGTYRLDASDRLLFKNEAVIPLPPKVFDTLLMLVTNAGHVVTKEEMLKQLWPDTFVEEGTLTQYISLLRKALGDDGRWIENLPRRGYRFMAPVQELQADPAIQSTGIAVPQPSMRARWLRIAMVVVPLMIVGSRVAWFYFSRPEPIRSLAVLPFLNLSGDSKFDYISDGLTEELTHALTRLEGIRVAARTSAFQFRGKNEDVRIIGQRLNVAGVLEGSVRVERNRVRVTAQLIDARSGHHVWSEVHEGNLDDLLSIEERIGSATAQKLALNTSIPKPASTLSRELFLPYLQGRYFLAKGRPETFRKAAESFKEVIAKHPDFARAHSGLADTYYRWALWESFPPAEAFSIARGAAERALALDETLAEAHASLANIKFQYDWDFAGAEREFRRSIALDPQRADTWHWFSHLLTARGRFAESEQASRKAIELEPFDLPSQNHLGWSYYFAGDFDSAIAQHRKLLDMDPAHGQTRLLLGRALLQRRQFSEAIYQLRQNLALFPESPERLAALAQAYAASGDRANAMELLDRLLTMARQRYVAAYSIAMVYAALGERAKALEYLERSAAERSSRVVEIKYEPVFETLRNEAAFQKVIKRIGL